MSKNANVFKYNSQENVLEELFFKCLILILTVNGL